MARTPGISYFHTYYDPEPKEDEPREHDLLNGPECWCEPKCLRIGTKHVLVVHDPEDGLYVVLDSGVKK